MNMPFAVMLGSACFLCFSRFSGPISMSLPICVPPKFSFFVAQKILVSAGELSLIAHLFASETSVFVWLNTEVYW